MIALDARELTTQQEALLTVLEGVARAGAEIPPNVKLAEMTGATCGHVASLFYTLERKDYIGIEFVEGRRTVTILRTGEQCEGPSPGTRRYIEKPKAARPGPCFMCGSRVEVCECPG